MELDVQDTVAHNLLTQSHLTDDQIQQILIAAKSELETGEEILLSHKRAIQIANDGRNSVISGWASDGNNDAMISSSRIEPVSDKVHRLQNRIAEIENKTFTGICIECLKPIKFERLMAEPATRRHSICKEVRAGLRRSVS